MKKIKYLLLTALFIFPIKAYATTINTDFDESTCTLNVSGNFTGVSAHDVQVLLTKKPNETKGLKNTELNNNSYSTSFVLTFDEETKLDVTVADQNGSGDTTKEDVTIPACELAVQEGRVTTIEDFDHHGHSITIKDATIGFDEHDRLDIDMLDIDGINAMLQLFEGSEEYDGFLAIKNGILDQLGEYKVFAQFMNVYLRDSHLNDIDYSNYTKGFILRLNMPKEVYNQYPGLKAAYFDQANIKIGDVIETSYDEENELFILNISKPGQFVFYIDNDYEFLDNTANPKFTLGDKDNLALRINAELSKFKKLTIDGKDVADVDKKSGSTILTISKDYLNTLSVGKHDVVAYFADGSAKTTLTVAEKEESVISKLVNPKTSDPVYIYIRLAILSFAGLSTVITVNKFKKKNN